MALSYTELYLSEVRTIAEKINPSEIDRMVDCLLSIRDGGGRLFFIGVGGGAGNCTHAVNDFRKISGFEAYTPFDNVSELTARINDDGWESALEKWLEGSRLNSKDGVFVFSVGGGNEEKNVSVNLVNAVKLAKSVGAKVFGVVGRDGGYTARFADACIIIPPINSETVTPHTESFQAVVWHLLVSHPRLRANEMKWESVK